MTTQWKYKQGDREFGPVTSRQLKELAAAGQLTADDLVWKEGLSDWVSARRVKGLVDSNAENAAAALSGVNLGANVEKLNLAAKPENLTATAEGRTSGNAKGIPVQQKTPPKLQRQGPSATEPQSGDPPREVATARSSAAHYIDWYYAIGGQRKGPVTGQELKQLVGSGELGPEDLVWHKGMQDWQQASRISGLIPAKSAESAFRLHGSTTEAVTVADKSSSGGKKLDDDELAKRLNRKNEHESVKGRVVKGGKRLWNRAKHDAKVLKLKHELTALQKSLDGHLQDGGKKFVSGEQANECPVELREELERITLEIEREEHRLETLKESRGTGSAKRRVRGDLKKLFKERDKVLIKIGRHAYEENSLDDEPTKKIKDLIDLITECKKSLEELEPSSKKELVSAEVRTAVRRRRIRKVVTAGIVACVVLVAFWSLNSFVLQPTLKKRFGPLSDFRHLIPDNSDLVLVMEEDVKDSEWGEELLRWYDEHASESSFETLAVSVDYSEMVRHVVCISFEASEDSALAGMFSIGQGFTIRFRDEARENFESINHQGEILRTRRVLTDYERILLRESNRSTANENAAPSDPSREFCVCETSWGDLLMGSSENVKSAIDNRAEQRVAKAYEELSRLAGEIPSGQSIWIVFRTLPKGLVEDVKIEGGFASLATEDSVVKLRAELTFPDEGEARIFVRYLDSWRDKNEEAFKSYGERLDLAVGMLVDDLLNNLKRSRDDRRVIITTSTSDRVLAKALRSIGKQSNAENSPTGRGLFSG